MKRFILLSLVALGALATAGGIAYSSGNPAAPAGQDRVYGGGRAGPPPGCSPDIVCTNQTRDFSLDVHAVPAGQTWSATFRTPARQARSTTPTSRA